MFSACTFVTRWLCNHDLDSLCTPFSCYHHVSYKLLQQSKMPTTESECHLSQQHSKNYLETIQKISLPCPNSSTDTLGLVNTASNRASQNNCWLYPKVKCRTKIQDDYILRFWISDFCIGYFKLPQQRAMVLPKNCTPFFGTCCNLILQEKLLFYTKDCRKCCVYSSIILYLPSPAKQCLVKRKKKKQLETVLIEVLTTPIFLPSGLHFYMLKTTRWNKKFLFFFAEENNKGEQNHLLTTCSL